MALELQYLDAIPCKNPFVALLWLPRPSTRRKRRVRHILMLVATFPIYLLSFAPCLVARTPVNNASEPSPKWVYTLFTTIYAPHYYLAYNETTQRPFLEMLAPHVQAWKEIESKCRWLFPEADESLSLDADEPWDAPWD